MNPGPELDARVCQALGIERLPHPRRSGLEQELREARLALRRVLPNYRAGAVRRVESLQAELAALEDPCPPVSTSWEAMRLVVEAMEARWFTLRTRCAPGAVREATFHRSGGYDCTATADELPEAVCRAVLKALGEE